MVRPKLFKTPDEILRIVSEHKIDIDCFSVLVSLYDLRFLLNSSVLIGKRLMNFDDHRLVDMTILAIGPFVICMPQNLKGPLSASLRRQGFPILVSTEKSWFSDASMRVSFSTVYGA